MREISSALAVSTGRSRTHIRRELGSTPRSTAQVPPVMNDRSYGLGGEALTGVVGGTISSLMPAVSYVGLACSQVDSICVVPWPCCAMRRAHWRPRVGPPRTGRPAPRRSPAPTRMARSARPSDGPGGAGVGRPVVHGRHTGAAPRQHHSGLGRGGDRAQESRAIAFAAQRYKHQGGRPGPQAPPSGVRHDPGQHRAPAHNPLTTCIALRSAQLWLAGIVHMGRYTGRAARRARAGQHPR